MRVRNGIGGIRQFLGPAANYRRLALPLFSAAFLVQLFALVIPMVSQIIVDHSSGLVQSDGIALVIVGYGIALGTAAVLEWMRSLWAVGVIANLELDSFPRAYGAAFPGLRRSGLTLSPSDVISRFQSLRTANQLLGSIVVEGTVDALFIVTTSLALLLYDSLIAVVSFVCVAAYFAARLLLGRFLTASSNEIARAEAEQVRYLVEETRAHHSIRFYGVHDARRRAWNVLVGHRVAQDVRRGRTTASLKLLQQICVGTVSVVTMSAGAHRVAEGELTIGAMFALVGLTFAMFSRMAALAERLSSVDVLGVHWRRFREMVHVPDEPVTPAPSIRHTGGAKPGLYIHHLEVRLGAGFGMEIRNAFFPAGRLSVIVGNSGGGKSTLVRALTGLVPASRLELVSVTDSPCSRAAGIPMQLTDWIKACSACFQGDSLFEALTYAENIACSDQPADMARVRAAAALACVDDDIVDLLGGYNAATRPERLSEGQSQRLLLARSLYRKASYYFLDEVTSAVPEATEARIIANILGTGATVIAVAHRAGWIKAADRVYVMEDGLLKVTEGPDGEHQDS